MFRKLIEDYFTFSRSERIAVIILSSSLLIICSLPYIVPRREEKIDQAAVNAFTNQLASASPEKSGDEARTSTPKLSPDAEKKNVTARLFPFDPNTLNAQGWRTLGLQEKTIAIIRHYLEKGGSFRRPEDLSRIYGLSPALAGRLQPYVKIAVSEGRRAAPAFKRDTSAGFHFKRYAVRVAITDISIADSLALVRLSGIGPRLAVRILNFREKIGGFYDVAQLAETFGLPDSTFQNLKPGLTASGQNLKKIHINTVGLELLKSHPYIRWSVANAIIAYRNEHGPFSDINDLNKVAVVTPEVFRKVAPYLEL